MLSRDLLHLQTISAAGSPRKHESRQKSPDLCYDDWYMDEQGKGELAAFHEQLQNSSRKPNTNEEDEVCQQLSSHVQTVLHPSQEDDANRESSSQCQNCNHP